MYSDVPLSVHFSPLTDRVVGGGGGHEERFGRDRLPRRLPTHQLQTDELTTDEITTEGAAILLSRF